MKRFTLLLFLICYFLLVNAQHSTDMKMSGNSKQMSDSMMNISGMNHAYSLNLPMGVDGSGTGPDFFNEDKTLQSLYGKNPMSFELYLRLHPGLMKMSH